ncbi:helix-turn-helix domain-containing protein [Marinigracilibium pacificum]|uniref:AraC family transcriptional regulator n=1 Tax=Marinigracilibium pacificum TaxID=2729599 RepID=A0A848J6I7_9BACT|nr:helix-turn-helix domain-containing protein [Marinigracilibium pacificum]NMM50130.1 AraC family transcriptional regulator [Marinigracilibium pacificum]
MSEFQTILLISGSQGIILSLGLITSGVLKKKQNLFLGLITLVFALEILTGWAVITKRTNDPDIFPFWVFSSFLIIPPALFLFGKLTTKAKFKIEGWHKLLFIPSIIEIISEFGSYFFNKYSGSQISLFRNSLWFWFTELLPLLSVIIVLFINGIDINALRNSIKTIPGTKSYQHLIKISVFYLILVLITIFWFLEAVINLPLFSYSVLLLCLIIFALGYISFFSPDFFDLPPILIRTTSFADSSIEARTEMGRINEEFTSRKIYLQPRLTIKNAAEQLNIKSRDLSELINTYYGTDFRRYINHHRINEVIEKINNGELKNKTLLGIAMDAGFNSKSSFNQAFKDIKGKSPKEYFNPDPNKKEVQ